VWLGMDRAGERGHWGSRVSRIGRRRSWCVQFRYTRSCISPTTRCLFHSLFPPFNPRTDNTYCTGAHRPRLLHESFPHHDHNKPLPPHEDDRSSLGPSRSASQIHLPNGMHVEEGSTTSLSHYSQSTDTHRIQIPAAHAIDSELAMPMPVMGYSGGHKRDSSASTPRWAAFLPNLLCFQSSLMNI
jgi:hypothetical protein